MDSSSTPSPDIDCDIDANGHRWVWEACPLHGRTAHEVGHCDYCDEFGFVYIDLDGGDDAWVASMMEDKDE